MRHANETDSHRCHWRFLSLSQPRGFCPSAAVTFQAAPGASAASYGNCWSDQPEQAIEAERDEEGVRYNREIRLQTEMSEDTCSVKAAGDCVARALPRVLLQHPELLKARG